MTRKEFRMNIVVFLIALALSTSGGWVLSNRLERIAENILEQSGAASQLRTRRTLVEPAMTKVLKHARLVLNSVGLRKFEKHGSVHEAWADFKSFHPTNFKSYKGVQIKDSGGKRIILNTGMGRPFIEVRYNPKSGPNGYHKPTVRTDIIQYN